MLREHIIKMYQSQLLKTNQSQLSIVLHYDDTSPIKPVCSVIDCGWPQNAVRTKKFHTSQYSFSVYHYLLKIYPPRPLPCFQQ